MSKTKRTMSPMAACMLAGLLLGACVVTSTQPVSELAASAPVSESWLGAWQAETILGEVPARTTTLEVESNADGSVQITLRDGDRAVVQNASLADLGGSTIASVRSDDGSWLLLKLVVNADATRLTVLALDADVVRADIEQGVIAGTVEGFDANHLLIGLTATSANLRSYLATHGAAFGPELAVLNKVPPPAP